ncbi:MAG TPA: hypothetical protein VLV83_07110 [Acidobacteriota bacterium]|nr:hypothetical protein [Acidobacteriota bacterium]
MDGSSIEIAFLIILVVFFIQSVALTVVLFLLSRRLEGLEKRFQKLLKPLDQTAETVGLVVDKMLPLSRKLPPLKDKIHKASEATLQTARESDERLEEIMGKLRDGLRDVDRQIDAGMQSYSRYSFQVHQSVLHPARKVSQVMQAIAGAARTFFTRGNSVSPEFVAEEEEFI